jgi:hypothetical protein
LLNALHRGRGGILHNLNGVIILPGAVCTTFIALLLQHFLSLGIRESQQQLYIVLRHCVVVELAQNSLRNFTALESALMA